MVHEHDRIINRVFVCLLVLCLLWLTSLQIAASVVQSYGLLQTPGFATVISQCSDYAFSIVEKQSRDYLQCASTETQQCRFFGQQAFEQESRRAAQQQASNDAQLQSIKMMQSSCTRLLSNVEDSIREWVHANASYFVPWRGQNLTASAAGPSYRFCHPYTQQRQRAQHLLSDSSFLSAGISIDAMQYSQNSDTVVSHLAEYSNALAAYNAHYVENKTNALEIFSCATVDAVLPQLSTLSEMLRAQFLQDMDEIVQCVGLRSAGNGTCNLGAKGM